MSYLRFRILTLYGGDVNHVRWSKIGLLSTDRKIFCSLSLFLSPHSLLVLMILSRIWNSATVRRKREITGSHLPSTCVYSCRRKLIVEYTKYMYNAEKNIVYTAFSTYISLIYMCINIYRSYPLCDLCHNLIDNE